MAAQSYTNSHRLKLEWGASTRERVKMSRLDRAMVQNIEAAEESRKEGGDEATLPQ